MSEPSYVIRYRSVQLREQGYTDDEVMDELTRLYGLNQHGYRLVREWLTGERERADPKVEHARRLMDRHRSMTDREVARLVGVSTRTIRRWRAARKI